MLIVMRGRLALVLGALIVLTAAAITAISRSTTSPGDPAKAVATGERQPRADPGARANIERAMKELDLIRPSGPKPIKDFALGTVDGHTFRLSEQRGKVVFINFWATWCPPCREEMPTMERLIQRAQKGSLVVLAVSVDADPTVVKQFLQEQRFTFAAGLDPKMELANAYGVRALPASFIVDREGRLAAIALGPRPWDSAASQALIEGMGY